MLCNGEAPFIRQCLSNKFINSVTGCVRSPTTSPLVRDGLILAIGGAAFRHGEEYLEFRALWREVKHDNAPMDGMPFDSSDPMFIAATQSVSSAVH
ncbi:hypothetical protein FRB93_002619 [Tulasnella sp. JGI-2019a]|nr:hypothetical protein FRB93_002619 [Tulasnella sp. JGI-2019a]